MSQAQIFRDQAAAADAAAAAATLDNVRERNLRSAQAWREMAERVERTDRLKAEREAAIMERLRSA